MTVRGRAFDQLRALKRSARWTLRLAWSTDRPSVGGLVLLTVVTGLLPAGLAVAVRGLINSVEGVATGATGDVAEIWLWLGVGITLALVRVIASFMEGLANRRLHDQIALRVDTRVLEHAAQLDVSFFERTRYRDMLQRARRGTADNIHRFLRHLLRAAKNLTTSLSLFIVLAAIEPLILPLMLIIAFPYMLFQVRQARRAYNLERSRAVKRRWTAYFSGRLTTSPSVAEVKLLGLAPLLLSRFRHLMEEFFDQDWKLHVKGFRAGLLFGVMSTLAVYAVFVRVVLLAIQGQVTIGDVAIFGGAATGLQKAVDALAISLRSAVADTLFVTDLMSFFDHRPRIVARGEAEWPQRRGELRFEDVTFAYPDTSTPVVDGLSLHVRPGETLALVGENGAGKTTLVKLAARLYEPDEGRILVDGVEIRELPPAEYRREIAFVFQPYGRYEASAGENIAYGDWQRLLRDRSAVEEVVQRAGLDSMVESMPDGLDTKLGRSFGEYDPSAGQWQLIAVARALARDATILILDEPSSSLDARAEYELFSRLHRMSAGRTTLLISHRFSTVAMADRIGVISDGRIVEMGTHDELMELGAVYASLYNLHRRGLV